jgi:hypothetical protein
MYVCTRYIVSNDNVHKKVMTVLWQKGQQCNELPPDLEEQFLIISAVETLPHAQYSERISSYFLALNSWAKRIKLPM